MIELSPSASAVVDQVRDACARAGFDLVLPLRVGWYNEQVQGSLRLADFGSDQHLGLIIGNTRALWPVWLDALGRDAALAGADDPLDTYTERSLSLALARIALPVRSSLAHERGDRAVPIQRVAHAAGLAFLSETHMSVHPTYGPWIALRAVVSVAVSGPPGAPAPMAHPCGGCARGCQPAFERALSTLSGAPSDANVRVHWREWLACRDACPVGREHRYSDAQIDYHYRRRLVLPRAD